MTPDVAKIDVTKVAEADFPTCYGNFRILGFRLGSEEAVALAMGDLTGAPPLLRIHSQCLTGDVFHSLRCDCRDQLELSFQRIAEEGRGLVIYEQKEGRGIGLMAKLQAYELQDQGMDTVEANRRLGFDADLRDYSLAGAILRNLGIPRVRLLSNNPGKISALEVAGVQVVERIPCEVAATAGRHRYLKTKKDKMGHLLTGV
jgi:GTP cyclohydrolase II